MKQTKWFLGALSLLTLAGCSNDIDVDNTPGVAEKDEMRYIKIAINGDMGSRAEEFTNGGTEAVSENTVNSVTLRFFDAAGNFIDEATPENVTEATGGNNTGNVNKKIVKVVGFEVKKGQSLPSYVLCFVNGGAPSDKTINMREYRNKTTDSYKAGDYFTMANSCYYGTDAVTGSKNVKISGTPIKPSQIFTSEAKANEQIENTDKEEEDNIVDIYVERNAVKVIFSLATNAVGNGVAYDGYTLKFVPEKWTVNADENKNYVLKKFAAKDGTIPNWSDLMAENNGILTTWEEWNSETNHRSYWACSPGYYATNFPQVSSDVTAQGANYSLKYYSYKEITGENSLAKEVATNGASNYKYTFENTVGKDAFNSINPNACCPSLLIVGKYKITAPNGESTMDLADGTTFYTKESKLYLDATPSGMTNAPLMKKHFIDSQTVLYVKEGDKYVLLKNIANETTKSAVEGFLAVQHPTSTNTNTKIPERYVTLQINSVPTEGNPLLYYIPNGTDTYTPVTTTNSNAVNNLLWTQVGVAEAYKSGMAYFSIPIRHLRASEDPIEMETGKTYDANTEIPWDKAKVGYFGLVRNHVYEIGVTSITKLGTGILDPEHPIVPPTKADKYAIKYNLNILNWRVVPKQVGITL